MRQKVGVIQAAAVLLAGIFIGLKFQPPLAVCAPLFLFGLAGGWICYRRGKEYKLDQLPVRLFRFFVYFTLIAAGMGRPALVRNTVSPGSIENYVGQRVEGLRVHIISPPVTTTSRTTLRVEVENSQEEENLPVNGKILLVFYTPQETEYHYGDRLSVSGTVLLPPDTGGFSYRDYLARSGIYTMINNPHLEEQAGFRGNRMLSEIYSLRAALVKRIYQLFPKPESALMAGILLGDESQITSSIDRDFQKTGTAHIIAISGANFTVLTWLLLGIVRRLVPRWWAPLLMLPFIAFYTVLVGGNSAVVRAAIMCGLTILGSVIGRTGNGLNNLALTAALMCLWKPVMMYDLGFQLSVTATLGILLFSDPISGLFYALLSKISPKTSEESRKTVIEVLNDLFIMSISAQVFTTWVSAQAFGQISLISIPANFLIAPFQSLIMLGGFAALLLSYVFYPLGAALSWLVWFAPALTIRIVQACAKIKGGTIYFDLPPAQAWLIIGLIVCLWAWRGPMARSIQAKNFRPYIGLLLVFAALFSWVNAADRLYKRTEISFQQSSSSMLLRVRSPENRTYVIGDGLTNYRAQDALEKQILPIPRPVQAAWLDISESWMRKEFLNSGTAEDLEVLYLNGTSRKSAAGVPYQLENGTDFRVDGISMRYVLSYLGKRAWLIESEGMNLLIPNGIPPERIFKEKILIPAEISLVVLGKRDSFSLWEKWQLDQEKSPLLQDFSDDYDVTLIITNTGLYYR